MLRFLCVSALGLVSAFAETLTYTDTGTFPGSAPNSSFTAPGGAWILQFEVDSQPTPVEFGNGGFNLPFVDFSYFLNGSQLSVVPSFIRFFSPNNGGGFMVCFDGTTVGTCTNGFITPFDTSPLYTGTTAAPTLIPGSFTFDIGATVNGVGFDAGSTSIQATPEPSTWLMLGASFLALVWRRRFLRT